MTLESITFITAVNVLTSSNLWLCLSIQISKPSLSLPFSSSFLSSLCDSLIIIVIYKKFNKNHSLKNVLYDEDDDAFLI